MNADLRKPRIIAVDMDGTLLASDGKVSARNRAALAAAHAQGVEIVIATGRRHCYAMGPLRGIGLHPGNALISSNGTVIRTVASGLIHRTHMPLATAKWLCAYASEYRSSMVLTFDTVLPNGDDTRGALVCERDHDLNGSIGRWMEANGAYIEYVDRLEDRLAGEPPIQMMMCGPNDRMRTVIAKLLESPKVARWGGPESDVTEIVLHRTEYPDKDLMILDILPVGSSKASALQHLAGIRGCTAAGIVAIGDNWNDLPMLELAGRSMVMANAPVKMLEVARVRGWTIAPANDEDGVAWAIDQVLQPVPA
jgi:hydroxymethylpyrimidine pyrophosphatase-like HAD family hydrolase